MIAKEGVPSFYIKLLANLEDMLATTLKDKPAIKKMSATNTRSLNRMKLQLRKHNKGCVSWAKEKDRFLVPFKKIDSYFFNIPSVFQGFGSRGKHTHTCGCCCEACFTLCLCLVLGCCLSA